MVPAARSTCLDFVTNQGNRVGAQRCKIFLAMRTTSWSIPLDSSADRKRVVDQLQILGLTYRTGFARFTSQMPSRAQKLGMCVTSVYLRHKPMAESAKRRALCEGEIDRRHEGTRVPRQRRS